MCVHSNDKINGSKMFTVANLGRSYIWVFFVLFAPFCKFEIISKEKFFLKKN